jgi:hypothetical protein
MGWSLDKKRVKTLLLIDENGVARPVVCDLANGGTIVTITTEHHHIHVGEHFTLDDVRAVTISPQLWMMQTPADDVRVHLVTKWQSTAATLLEIFENATVSVPGTALQPVNNDRNSQRGAKLQVSVNPIVVNLGTRIRADHSGAAGIFTGGPGQAERNNELILKKNTIYIVRGTQDSGSITLYFSWSWYEVSGPPA